jgi:predicted RNA-binding protein associated with RNAse of E/G family
LSEIEIRYTRLPDRTTVFHQQLVLRTDSCLVTLLEHTDLARPLIVHDTTVLESGSPVVWFTFPGRWHDIGRFHTRDGTFTGYYANILTPVNFLSPTCWETTDLFLDLWLGDGDPVALDRDELTAARAAGAVSAELAARAELEAAALLEAARTGAWPPLVCREWTLERARGTPGGTLV